MKFSTLFAASLLASASFGTAALAQGTAVDPQPTGEEVIIPGSDTQQNSAEEAERDSVSEGTAAETTTATGATANTESAIDPRPGGEALTLPGSETQQDAADESERDSVAAGTAAETTTATGATATGETAVDPQPGTEEVILPGSDAQQDAAEEEEREEVAQ